MRDNASAYNANIYDENIIKTLPYYAEFHKQILDLVNVAKPDAISWLDTGCGTGTLAQLILMERDNVHLTLSDPSEKMLAIAKDKLSGKDVTFMNVPSEKLSVTNAYDVITAVQCHHYFDPVTRALATKNCFNALKDGGIFITFENIKMSTDESDAIGVERWFEYFRKVGKPENIELQRNRRGSEFFPITIEDHINLYKETGFSSVNLLWTSYLQAGFWMIK